MKKILILGLLLVSHLWGMKEWSDYVCTNREEWCLETFSSEESRNWCETETPTLPNDYKPTKEDKVLKVKVGNVEGEIVGVKGKGIFIRASSQKDFSYVDKLRNPSELFLVNYPQYSVMVQIDNSGDRNDGGGSVVDFYQIFAVGDELKAFLLGDGFSPIFPLFCSIKRNDSPCPYTKNDVLDWIKKQGGQKLFDYACPAYFVGQATDKVCNKGVIEMPL